MRSCATRSGNVRPTVLLVVAHATRDSLRCKRKAFALAYFCSRVPIGRFAMAALAPPSRYEVAGFPVFAISWYGDPSDGTSIVAFSGGGGSAKTGIKNTIALTIGDEPEPRTISTGTDLANVLHIYCNLLSKRKWLLASVDLDQAAGCHICRYSIPECQLNGIVRVRESSCSALAVNALTDRLAMGCEDGNIYVFP